jgi:hypothetical protein
MPVTKPGDGAKVQGMKTYKTKSAAFFAATVSLVIIGSATCGAADTNLAPERIGTYDSRVVAYAYFSSEAHLGQLRAEVKAAKDTKAAGDIQRSSQMGSALKAEQDQIHLQVFSTAPIDNVLAEIRERLPEIQKEAGVSVLISKWDKSSLDKHPRAQTVDVTDALAREFKPGEKQLKVMADIKRQKPVPLDRMKTESGS